MPALNFELGVESPMINDVVTRAFQNGETDALVHAFWKSPLIKGIVTLEDKTTTHREKISRLRSEIAEQGPDSRNKSRKRRKSVKSRENCTSLL